MSIISVLLFLCTAAVSACGTTDQEESHRAVKTQSAPDVRETMLVSSNWLATNLQNQNLVVLHVATSRENYEEGHIPGAHYLGWEQFTRVVDGVPNELPPVETLTDLIRNLGIDSGKRVVIYDEENGFRAARAYFTLDYIGLGENSSLLDGQLAHWKAGNLPLNSETATAVRSGFEPTVNERIVIGMNELQSLIDQDSRQKILLDCRPPDQFSGIKPGKQINRGGHIPGASNLPALKTVVSAETPLFLQPAELRKVYEQAGFTTDRPIVTYCRTGRSASLSYFTLKYLGYEARLYDGSFIEWQGTKDNVVGTGE